MLLIPLDAAGASPFFPPSIDGSGSGRCAGL